MRNLRNAVACVAAGAGLVIASQAGCSTPAPQHRAAPLAAPPMGWNSWNSGIDPTEHNIESVIDAMVTSGMRDAGYRYVNLDAGWASATRDSHGHLTADPQRFPDGIAAVADYAHRHGMMLGLYASPYNEGCSAQPALASVGHEDADAHDFASWGVDYLKYDWCRASVDHDAEVTAFTRMRDALEATGRHIVYSINPNSTGDETAGNRYDWSGIADTARTGADLVPAWRLTIPPIGPLDVFGVGDYIGVPDAFAAAVKSVRAGKPGFYPDPDMLVAGVGWNQFADAHFAGVGDGLTVGDVTAGLHSGSDPSTTELTQLLQRQPSLTDAEQRAHLSLWALLSAPLIAGNDVRTMSPQTRDILTNREVIAIDQDPKAATATLVGADDRILAKPLSDGSVAVALINVGDAAAPLATSARDVGLPAASCYSVRDVWAHLEVTSAGPIAPGAVPPHSVTLLRVAPACH